MRRGTRGIALALTLMLLLGSGGSADAQAVGSRVRITGSAAGARPTTGHLVALTDDSLSIQREGLGPRSFARSDIARLEVSGGRNRWGSAVKGLTVGAVAGGIIGAVAMSSEENGQYGLVQLLGAISGALVGAPIGGVTGAIVARERWTPVPGHARTAGLTVAWSLSF